MVHPKTKLTIAESYQPHPKQVEVHRCGKRWVVVSAGVRGGKSVCGAVEFCRRIFLDLVNKPRKARRLYWIIGPTFKLTEYAWDYIREFIPSELVEKTISNAQARELHLTGGIKIECHGADRPERLVGASVSGMLVEEACRVKAQTWKGSLRGRLADNEGWAIFTSSPLGGRNNWIFQEFVSKANLPQFPEIASISWTTEDNPHISRAEIAAAKQDLAPEWYAREFLASWDSFGGAIYSEFRDEHHVLTEAAFRLEFGLGGAPFTADMIRRHFRRVVCGVDFGWTSPGSMVVIGHLGDTRMVVLEESYAAQRPINGDGTTWASEGHRLMKKWGVQFFACDTEDPEAIRDLSIAGLPAGSAWKNVYHGIRRVAEGLHVMNGRPGLRIMENCVNLIREKRNYQWKSLRDQSGFMEEPADGQSDHALDAERYAVVELRPFATTANTNNRGQASYR